MIPEEENIAEWRREYAELKRQLRSGMGSTANQFVDSDGVKWKRTRGWNLEEFPYCPKCLLKMQAKQKTTTTEFLVCESCGHPAFFAASELEAVRVRVEKVA